MAKDEAERPRLWSVRMRAAAGPVHISGAEGLYPDDEIIGAASRYALRALSHPRGMPDSITITIERLRKGAKEIGALPLCTLRCGSTDEADKHIRRILDAAGVSKTAISRGLRAVRSKALRGAAIISAEKGVRLDPDRTKGVRASRLGIDGSALKSLKQRLRPLGIDTDTVREALILASKVASCGGVIAELCVSDDPGYTTGYVASRKFGYVRIPNIKESGGLCGGRAVFVKEGADISRIIAYLKRRPVIVAGLL